LAEIYDLNAAGSVLTWDEATYMPSGGAAARGRQVAILRRLAHERFTDPALGKLLDGLEKSSDDLSADDASLIRAARRDYERPSVSRPNTSRARTPTVRRPTMPGDAPGPRTISPR
jgi:carboxypeptidase Taq